MEKFLEELEKNEELKAKVEELGKRADAVSADFIALAKEYGFTLTEEDFHAGQTSEGELSDVELDSVSGGVCCCACVAGGGGTYQEPKQYIDNSTGGLVTLERYTCVCAALGYGVTYVLYEDGSWEIWENHCFCFLGGGGEF